MSGPSNQTRGTAGGSSQPAVELIDVSKTYDGVPAVVSCGLVVQEGEIVTLLGPSGSGKTTLLRLIAGFIMPTGGTVFLRGQDVTYTPPQKRNTAMVFQNYALFPHMTVFDNVAFGLRMRNVKRNAVEEKVMAALQIAQLEGFAKRTPKQLSGGQQQRVALVRALVTEPDVLLMDESLGALDRKLREEMQIEIKTILKRLGATALHVTHDQEEALVLSDRIAVMRNGRIEQIDSPVQLYNEPATPFVAEFVGVSNRVPAEVRAVNGGECEVVTAGGLTLRCLGDNRVGDRVQVVLRPEKLQLYPRADAPIEANVVPGVVRQLRYLGLSVQYVVETPFGHDLLAVQLNQERPELMFAPGQEVSIAFPLTTPRLLRDADTSPTSDAALEEANRMVTAH